MPKISQENKDEVLEFVEQILTLIPPEAFITETYFMIKKKIDEYSKGIIKEIEFKAFMEEIKKLVENSIEDYDESYISIDEWTIEVAAGDRLLRDGLEEYRESIVSLLAMEGYSTLIEEELIKIYEANKKLVATQYVST